MKNTILKISIVGLFLILCPAQAAIKHVLVIGNGSGVSHAVAANEVVRLIWVSDMSSGSIQITKSGATWTQASFGIKNWFVDEPITIAGPCTVTVNGNNTQWLTLKIWPNPSINGAKQ